MIQFKKAGCLAAVVTAMLSTSCGGSKTTPTFTLPGKFVKVNLVADTAGATTTDANLKNAWGMAFSPSGPFWISANGTGKATVYDGSGTKFGLEVDIPSAAGGIGGPVTGQVYNGTAGFVIPAAGAANFIFSSEDGVISAWNSGTAAVVVNDRSATGAVYKGLALGGNFLYATNFHSGMVDVFDSTFAFVKSFTDSTLPAGYAPFGVTIIDGKIWVSFAVQNGAMHDDVPGAGNGAVVAFNSDGSVATRFVKQGHMNSPWAVVKAPAGFGALGGQILVGNFGDGLINAYDRVSGTFLGTLEDSAGAPLVIDGLWALGFGNGGSAGSTGKLYFTAGPNSEANGLFGSLTPTP